MRAWSPRGWPARRNLSQAPIAVRFTQSDKAALDLSAREYFVSNVGTQRQSEISVGIFYTLLGQHRFGTVDWR